MRNHSIQSRILCCLSGKHLPAAYKPINKAGFTYMEMLIVIALIALCFVPLLHMFARSVDEVGEYSRMTTAIQLGEEAMESLKNLRWTEKQIERQGETWLPEKSKPAIQMNQELWRIRRGSVKGTDPLEVYVDVFEENNLQKPMVHLVALVEDF